MDVLCKVIHIERNRAQVIFPLAEEFVQIGERFLPHLFDLSLILFEQFVGLHFCTMVHGFSGDKFFLLLASRMQDLLSTGTGIIDDGLSRLLRFLLLLFSQRFTVCLNALKISLRGDNLMLYCSTGRFCLLGNCIGILFCPGDQFVRFSPGFCQNLIPSAHNPVAFGNRCPSG